MSVLHLSLVAVMAPLIGSIVVGLFGRWISRSLSHTLTIAGVAISLIASGLIFNDLLKSIRRDFNNLGCILHRNHLFLLEFSLNPAI